MFIERITRIELASPAWEADALTIVLYSQMVSKFASHGLCRIYE